MYWFNVVGFFGMLIKPMHPGPIIIFQMNKVKCKKVYSTYLKTLLIETCDWKKVKVKRPPTEKEENELQKKDEVFSVKKPARPSHSYQASHRAGSHQTSTL